MSIDEVIDAVAALRIKLVELTGGEPLLQAEAPADERLIDRGFTVLLETGGHLPIDDVPDEAITIMDVKCPGSGEAASMHWPNIEQLSLHDEVKFVIADRVDFDFACGLSTRTTSRRVAAVLFSPVHGALARRAWIWSPVAGAPAASGAQIWSRGARRLMAQRARSCCCQAV
jgi:7-carboxy-7-deazaguanine synthase